MAYHKKREMEQLFVAPIFPGTLRSSNAKPALAFLPCFATVQECWEVAASSRPASGDLDSNSGLTELVANPLPKTNGEERGRHGAEKVEIKSWTRTRRAQNFDEGGGRQMKRKA